MLLSILKFIIVIVVLCVIEGKPVIESKCSPSMLGCLCQDLEYITEKEVQPCCTKPMETLIITGQLVRNISLNIEKSNCTKNFISLMIRETGLIKFYSPFKGLQNVCYVNIEKNQNLTEFNKLIFEEINPDMLAISVEFNSFRTISKKTFANLTKLTSLRLSDNKIGFIEDRSFSGIKNLSSLHMNNNILTVLNSEVFFDLESLIVLNLFNNPLQEPISNDLFKYLKSLRHLMMSHDTNVGLGGISQLPQKIFFEVKQLRTLNMTNIRLKHLTTSTFYGLNELERLDLQGNKLVQIPSGTLQQIPKIGSINLSNNQLTCFYSDTFHNLPRLANLDISRNDITFISEEVFKDLTKLQTLDLAENNLYVIERNAFVGLRSLMIIKINVIHGRAKNEIQTKFMNSSLAKLRNTTKIVGLMEFFGISKGFDQPAELPSMTKNDSLKISDQQKSCPIASVSDKDWADNNNAGSRKYLLIIVGICVVFLLIAFTIIMTYRAWSKRRMNEMGLPDESDEKQEMLQNKAFIINGRIDKPVSKTNHHSRKSINGGSGPDHTGDVNMQPQQRHSNSQLATIVKPSTISDVRSHSDDESALTPLGVL